MEEILIEIQPDKRESVIHLFSDFKWNYMPNAILEGLVGTVLADDADNPQVAVLQMMDGKLNIVGGNAAHPTAATFVGNLPAFSFIMTGVKGWLDLIEKVHTGRLTAVTRYAMTSENLDIEHLNQLKRSLPDGYRIHPIDLPLAQQLYGGKGEVARDLLDNFASPEDFVERGIGYCVLHDDKVVGAISSFVICSQGVEIQVATDKKHRGRGLATAIAAHFMVHCLERGLDPNWDAADKRSLHLAKKLGYTPQGEYKMIVYVKFKAIIKLQDFLRWVMGKKKNNPFSV